MQISKNKSWKKFAGIDFQLPYSSVYVRYAGSRNVKIRIGSDKSEEFTLLAKKFFDNNLVLRKDAASHFEDLINQAANIDSSFRCYSDVIDFIIEHREKHNRKKILEEKYLARIENGAFDELIKAKLFPYQKEGIRFAFEAGRCLIADDMGLGKTIQAIAVAELMKKEINLQSVLIVCPTSLKYQWKSEIEKFTESKVHVIEGSVLKREPQYKQTEFFKIVSYHTLANDISKVNDSGFDLVILDEAQRIKNYKTKIAQQVKKINTPFSVVLTGTPLENKLEEIYSIVQFINPYKLGPFYMFLNEHQIRDDKGKIIGYQNLNRIGEMLADTMIRRKKSEVLTQLPKRMDKNLFVAMTEKQIEIHDEYKSVVNRLVDKWRRIGFLKEKDRQSLMIGLNMMRMVCDSTYIIDQETRFDTKIEEVMNIVDEVINQGKEKIVIFSQWERMTRLVAKELKVRKIKFEYLYGGVPSADRKVLFENFTNNDESKIFLSTDAGGVGLNLQAASLLINLDIPWNPAVLEQRISRIYRLGQTKNVNIINMVAAGTIEERMLDVLSFKSSMAEGVLDGGEDTIFMGESKFSKFMHSVEQMVEPSVAIDNPIGVNEYESELKIAASENEKVDDAIQENLIPAEMEDEEATVSKSIDNSGVSSDSPEQIMNMGFSFFNKLAEVLSNKESTQRFVSSIVQKEPNGQTYLKIPVENAKTVENIFSLFSNLMNLKK